MGQKALRLPLAALVAVLLWGASFVATRRALASFTPFGLVFLRLLLGTPLLWLALRARGGALLPRREDRPRVLVLGLLLAAHLAIQAFGLLYTSAIHTGWIIGFMPVPIALGALVFRGERFGAAGWAGALVAAAGVACVSLEDLPDLAHARWGDALQLSSCLTWTAYTLLGARAVAQSGALRSTAAAMTVALALLAPAALARGLWTRPPAASEVGALVFLGVFCSALALVLWYRAQAVYGSQRSGAMLYLEPFVTLAVGVLWGGERAGPQALLGGALVVCGVLLTALRPKVP